MIYIDPEDTYIVQTAEKIEELVDGIVDYLIDESITVPGFQIDNPEERPRREIVEAQVWDAITLRLQYGQIQP